MKEPRARFCACAKERFKLSSYVYIKSIGPNELGVLTTCQDEADERYKTPIGVIDNQGQLKLDSRAELALSFYDIP